MNKRELEKHICSTLDIDEITSTMKKQISRFVVERGYTYDEIAHALTFYIEVKEEKFLPKYGIAFVDWTIPESNKYFKSLEIRKQEQLKSIEKEKEQTNIILKPKKIKKRQPIPKVDIDNLGDD